VANRIVPPLGRDDEHNAQNTRYAHNVRQCDIARATVTADLVSRDAPPAVLRSDHDTTKESM